MASDAAVQGLLKENSTLKYYVEYGPFRSNHLAHGLLALHALGATEQRMRRFIELYVPTLEESKQHSGPEVATGEDRVYDHLLGARKSYYLLLSHYKLLLQTKYDNSPQAMVAEIFPRLHDGLTSSAFHCLIQLGYGIEASNTVMICEGLAYLHFSNLPFQTSPGALNTTFGGGDRGILEVLKDAGNNIELKEYMLEREKDDAWVKRNIGSFQPKLGVLVTERGDDLLNYADQIKLPDFFNPKAREIACLTALLNWIVDCAITLYVISERRNDFFLIHGVTAAWSLKQVVPLLKDYDQAIRSIRLFLCAIPGVYIVQGAPALKPEYLNVKDGDNITWDEIIDETLKDNRNVHIYKVVQVCRSMDIQTGDPNKTAFYKQACLVALRYPLEMFSLT